MAEPAPPSASPSPSGRALTPHIAQVFAFAVEHGASDVHVNVSVPPVVRIDGKLRSLPGEPAYTPQSATADVLSTLSDAQRARISEDRELDFSFAHEQTRYRANVFFEKEHLVGAYRLIPEAIRTVEQLGLPPILRDFLGHKQGLVVITGPTGHGKSTTLAALIDEINTNRSDHIITIEDPIEYVFANKKSIIAQREVGDDTKSFGAALRSAVRQDPNVLLVGEMRDQETMEAALQLAETGHLIFTTLHTNSAAATADRIIDAFPPHQQSQVRAQLASVLLGVVSQRLIPKMNGGRVLAAEILVATPAVKNTIREGKTHQIDNIIQTSAAEGMLSLDAVLGTLVSRGEITIDDALTWANDAKQLKLNVY
ncbi:type IV pilus twitching motility protein PilT [Candidatus Berkelbacteria bacterium]|nr:type IV pilus twitching motility protein PilT [Candidatus Berkelbacteria bacterium]